VNGFGCWFPLDLVPFHPSFRFLKCHSSSTPPPGARRVLFFFLRIQRLGRLPPGPTSRLCLFLLVPSPPPPPPPFGNEVPDVFLPRLTFFCFSFYLQRVLGIPRYVSPLCPPGGNIPPQFHQLFFPWLSHHPSSPTAFFSLVFALLRLSLSFPPPHFPCCSFNRLHPLFVPFLQPCFWKPTNPFPSTFRRVSLHPFFCPGSLHKPPFPFSSFSPRPPNLPL